MSENCLNSDEKRLYALERRVEELESAIRLHRDQHADDRCWMDDDRLYDVLGDSVQSDPRVGDKAEMLKNCARFIERRCQGGHWPTYVELEAERDKLRQAVVAAYRIVNDEGEWMSSVDFHTLVTVLREGLGE